MSPDEVIDAWFDAALGVVPDELEVWDAHAHTGQNDPDGFAITSSELLNALDSAGHAGSVFMTSADPAGYDAANDRILEEAADAEGALLPFLRVDPHALDPSKVRERFDAGFVGIKLHPRSEAFSMAHPGVEAVCRIGAEVGAPVLVHSGRGIPALADDVLHLVDDVDGLDLILAHCAISDLARLGPIAAQHPGLHFDVSWWDATDRLALAAWVPPGQILYASDTPYGEPRFSFAMAARIAAAAGYDELQMRGHFGGTLRCLVQGDRGQSLGPAVGDGFLRADAGLLRVHSSLHAALGASFIGAYPEEPISLARAGCDVDPSVEDAEVYGAIAATLDAIEPDQPRTTFRLLVIAAAAALTPAVPVPDLA